jgi:TonB-linked SusC/RagA family outer membrane protein
MLEELVVVGFGTQKKVNLTGAVATVSAKDLQNRPVSNVQQALQGLVPGLNIQLTNGMLDATPSINIRGVGTIGAGSSASPLVLIDGVAGNLTFLNPQDIESISVLKDAAASSIYGSRAPFGVILVTTKKGSADKIQVNYSNNFRWAAPTVQPDMMDSYTIATFINDAHVNNNQTPYISPDRLQRIKDYRDGILKQKIPIDPDNPTRWLEDSYSYGNGNTDLYDLIYKDWAFQQEHNVSASGGNKAFNFYASMGYVDRDGLLELSYDDYQRYTAMGKIEARMTDWMTLSYSTRFIRANYDRPSGLRNPTGNADTFYENLGRQGWAFLSFLDDNGNITPGTQLGTLAPSAGRHTEQRDGFINHASLELEPIKNWVTTAEFNYNVDWSKSRTVSKPMYIYDIAGNPYRDNRSTGSVSHGLGNLNFLKLKVYSSYQYTWNEVHNFRLMAGGQMEKQDSDSYGLNRIGLYVNEMPVINLTNGIDYNGLEVTPGVSGSMDAWSTAGYFGRFNYDYQGRYLLEANLRYDGTSRFRQDKRWNWFPSFSAGWNIAREPFWKDLEKYVNLLKLRGSYGKLGNQNTDLLYPTYEVMSVGTNQGTWLQNGAKTNVAYSPSLVSSLLTWEKIYTTNGGGDIGMFNNRLTGSFDYFVRKTLEMQGPARELPNILGKSAPRANNTDLKTYGFELELAWQDRLRNGLSYGVRFLLSDYQTIITNYPNETMSLNSYYSGKKDGEIWGFETIAIAKSTAEMAEHLALLPNGGQNSLGSNWAAGDIMYKDLNGDGTIDGGAYTLSDHGDYKVIGNMTPRYQFGTDFNLEWKGFDLRLFFQGVGKRDYAPTSSLFFGINSWGFWNLIGLNEHVDYFRAEPSNDLPANLDAYYPRPLSQGAGKNQRIQTRYLQNAAYLRLKNFTVGYTLPKQISQKFSVSQMRLFFSAENCWTYTKMATMYDPEAIDASDNANSGEGYPIQKMLSLGLNITL